MVATAREDYAQAQPLQAEALARWRETDSVRGVGVYAAMPGCHRPAPQRLCAGPPPARRKPCPVGHARGRQRPALDSRQILAASRKRRRRSGHSRRFDGAGADALREASRSDTPCMRCSPRRPACCGPGEPARAVRLHGASESRPAAHRGGSVCRAMPPTGKPSGPKPARNSATPSMLPPGRRERL